MGLVSWTMVVAPVVAGSVMNTKKYPAAAGIFSSPVVAGIRRCCGETTVVAGQHPLLRESERLARRMHLTTMCYTGK